MKSTVFREGRWSYPLLNQQVRDTADMSVEDTGFSSPLLSLQAVSPLTSKASGVFCCFPWTVALYPHSLQLQQLLVLRIGVECSACLFLEEDICLYELVKLLKDSVFCSVQDYGL